MKISVFGIGYVGCVTAACLARVGHRVIGVDVDPYKVQAINDGEAPFFEPGLSELVHHVVQDGSLRATLDESDAIHHSEVALVCVGTPTNSDGSIRLKYLKHVLAGIGNELRKRNDYFVVALRSTVLPSAITNELIPHLESQSAHRVGQEIGFVYNPEFLREGTALKDFHNPPWTIIGSCDSRASALVKAIYRPLSAPVIQTDPSTAALVKYFSNAFHALKVVFANEVGSFCRELGIDGGQVMEIFCQDTTLNISRRYLKPGFAFGGSCLPKDLKALMAEMGKHNLSLPLLRSIIAGNEAHLNDCIQAVVGASHRRIGLVGLSFKAGTDDLRESPAVELAERLIGKGFDVKIYEPNISADRLHGTNLQFIERSIPHIWKLLVNDLESIIKHADTVVLMQQLKPEDRKYFESMSPSKVCIDLARTLSADAVAGEYRSMDTPMREAELPLDTLPTLQVPAPSEQTPQIAKAQATP